MNTFTNGYDIFNIVCVCYIYKLKINSLYLYYLCIIYDICDDRAYVKKSAHHMNLNFNNRAKTL